MFYGKINSMESVIYFYNALANKGAKCYQKMPNTRTFLRNLSNTALNLYIYFEFNMCC